MAYTIHTVDVLNGSNINRQDRVLLGALSAVAFPASANAVTAFGAITPGSGFKSINTVSLAPTGGTGSGLSAIPLSLKAVSATLGNAGSGYAANDTINLGNGVVITVNTVTSGAIATFTVTNGGSVTNAPANPVAQSSTSGSGTGATFSLAWGLGTALITNSGSYTAAPSMTVTDSSGNGTGASIATGTLGGNGAAITVWAAMSLPPSYNAQITPNLDCRVNIPAAARSLFGFAVNLVPPTGGTLAAGAFDALVIG